MKKCLVMIMILQCYFLAESQSYVTLKMMHYNVLAYSVNTSYCTTSNNSLTSKDQKLRLIIPDINPDIVTLNEVYKTTSVHQRLLDSVFNVGGITYYAKGTATNLSGSNEVSLLIYNSQKLGITSSFGLSTDQRDLSFYRMYYKDPNLATTHDTAHFYCVLTHLKAGSADSTARAGETLILMNKLNTMGADNYIFSGDCNFYTSAEPGFLNLLYYTNFAVRFYDPINQMGLWHENSNYAQYHTQSTSTNSSNTCLATGGMDDRFDFILISQKIRDGLNKVTYVPGSYYVYGNDGNHFNGAINSPANTAVSATIANALNTLSDHLPVVMNLKIQVSSTGIAALPDHNFSVSVPACLNGNLEFYVSCCDNNEIRASLYSLLGQKISEKIFTGVSDLSNCSMPVNIRPGTMYLLQVTDKYHNKVVKKFIAE